MRKPITSDTEVTTEDFLANEYVDLRVERFKKLHLRVKKLLLEVVLYYLGTFHAFDGEANNICRDIEAAKKQSDQSLMAECYKRFLEFLPVRLRSGIQGKNLFKQPTDFDLMLSHFYNNDLDAIKSFNEVFYTRDPETGMTNSEHLRLMEIYLERELNAEEGGLDSNVQLNM